MEKAKATVFFRTDVITGLEVTRLRQNETLLNLAKGNCEHGFSHEDGEGLRERCKYVYALLQGFRPSRWDSEENDRVALCLCYLRLGFYGCWHEPFYQVARACLVELYPALTVIKKRLELWRSIEKFGEVCKAAHEASAYTLPGASDEDPQTRKVGSPLPVEVERAIQKMIRDEKKRRKKPSGVQPSDN
jgi:hypothetical protein